MTIELKKGYIIDSCFDKSTRRYITTLKDNEGNKVRDAYYSSNMTDRNSDIQQIKEFFYKYMDSKTDTIKDEDTIDSEVVEESLKSKIIETKKKTKKAKLSALSTISPIMPDGAAGIATFNSGVGLSEEYLNREELITRISKMGFKYKFDKYSDAALYRIYQERLRELEHRKKVKREKKQRADELENKRVNSQDSYFENDIEFESEDAAREYFGESMYTFEDTARVRDITAWAFSKDLDLDTTIKVVERQMNKEGSIIPNNLRSIVYACWDDLSDNYDKEYFREGKTVTEKFYLNTMHEAYDIVDEEPKARNLNESLSKTKTKSLRESLKQRDRDDFDKLSECYELEMLYEAVEKDLSKEDVEAIKNYANDNSNSSEEVAAYIKGKLDEEIGGGSLKVRLNNVKMMHEVIKSMNNENAYGSWIYTMPDCPDESDFKWFAEDKDEYKDLIDTFNRIYNRYKKDGLYKPSEEILDFLNYSGYGDVEVLESLNESSNHYYVSVYDIDENKYPLLEEALNCGGISLIVYDDTHMYNEQFDAELLEDEGINVNALIKEVKKFAKDMGVNFILDLDRFGESLTEAASNKGHLSEDMDSAKDVLFYKAYDARSELMEDILEEFGYTPYNCETIEDIPTDIKRKAFYMWLKEVRELAKWHDDMDSRVYDIIDLVDSSNLDESLNERWEFKEIDDAIYHFRNDLGIDPDDSEDVLEFIENNYPEIVPDGFDEYQKWAPYMLGEISARLNESLKESLKTPLNESYYIREWWGQVDENPYDVAGMYNLDIRKIRNKYDSTLYEFSGDLKDLNKAKDDGYFYDSDIIEVKGDLAILQELVTSLEKVGFILDESTLSGGLTNTRGQNWHLQVINPNMVYPNSETEGEYISKEVVDRLFMDDLKEVVQVLDEIEHKYPYISITFNFGANKDNIITGGIDMRMMYNGK